MKLIDLYKTGKDSIKKLNLIEVPKKINTKSTIFTTLFTIILGLPFIVIFGSLITVFSPIRTMFWVTLVLICLVLPIIMGLSGVFNLYLLKNYLEDNKELQEINLKAIFVKELLNPISWLLGIVISVVICYMAM